VRPSCRALSSKNHDKNLHRALPILERLSDSWGFLNVDVKQKLELYVESLPENQFDHLEFLLEHTGLSKPASNRLNKTTRAELNGLLLFGLPKQIGDRIVKLFIDSNSF
jgi:hypothetical protein